MRKKVVSALVGCLIIILGLLFNLFFFAEKGFRVIFFDVGQGDSALIQFDDGAKMLVDCGPNRKVLTKLGKYLPFYDRTIDYLLITHPDLDHYGGCADVLKRYEVKNIITNGAKKEFDAYWQVWYRYQQEERAVASVISGPKELAFAGSELNFLAPDPALGIDTKDGDYNNRSIVFRLSRASTTIMFTGDMEEPLEQALLAKYCSSQNTPPPVPPLIGEGCTALRSDILKVGHHGSDSSTSAEFLRAVNADKAIISVGKNRYGHPSLRVLKKLERAAAEILRTDEIGDIIMK
ncbi:MBL fold metallo-hydrolase [Patescibacteria group bacterium]|nr:MAG: MBL fold metallo-hydrolase [Patescibacteria group bacterium]